MNKPSIMNPLPYDTQLNNFLAAFPLNNLPKLDIKNWVINKNTPTLCHHLENDLAPLGSVKGGNSEKYGIFKFKKQDKKNKRYAYDNEYAWLKDNGKSSEEVFAKIKAILVEVATCANNGNFAQIEAINTDKILHERVKWKIAFLYSNKKLFPIFNLHMLVPIAKSFNDNINSETPLWKIYETILSHQNGQDIWDFANKLSKKFDMKETIEYLDMEAIKEYLINEKGFKKAELRSTLGYLQFFPEELRVKKYFNWIHYEYIYHHVCLHIENGFNKSNFHSVREGIKDDFLHLKPNEAENYSFNVDKNGRLFDNTNLFCKMKEPVKDRDDLAKKFRQIQDDFKMINFKQLFMENPMNANIQKYIELLKANRNLIFHGAPGTGKTYTAKQMASQMIFGEIIDENAMTDEQKEQWKMQCGFVQFHPSYDYTDFVEGLRPCTQDADNQNVSGFARQDGVFKKFCKKAAQNAAEPYIFLIDEINRGESSKIFGELFFSIDPGYRGKKGTVKTQYQNLVEAGDSFEDGFYIPENVYVIGTMNDIDRSVDSMDFAFRRRFAWIEIETKETQMMLNTILKSNSKEGLTNEQIDQAKTKMDALNDLIAQTDDLGRSYQIGAAYFMKLRDYNGNFAKLWNYHLHGLLVEYLRGTGNEEKINDFKNAYFSTNPQPAEKNDAVEVDE